MIRFALTCGHGHDFEGWFRDGDGFEELQRQGLVECTICGSTSVEKSIMAPRVARTDLAVSASQQDWVAANEPAALLSPQELELRQRLHELRAQLTDGAEDVGASFAEEARQIHFGEKEHRKIFGRATFEEARDLIEDGIGILPLPPGPDDRN